MRNHLVTYLIIGWICLLSYSSIAFAELSILELQLPTHKDLALEKAIFSGDGRKMAVFCQEAGEQRYKDQVIFIYDFLLRKWMRGIERNQGFQWELEPLALNQDGTLLAYRDGEDLVVLELATYKQIQRVEAAGSMTRAVFSESGDQLAFLMIAEWEIPTSLYQIDLNSGTIQEVVAYSGDTKVAGPIYWDREQEIYFIEEFTWGTINARGILKKFLPEENDLVKVYEPNWSSSRVAKYYLSPNGQYLAMMIRHLDEALENSEYTLSIQKQGKFVHGTKLVDWRDRVEPNIRTNLSYAGWIANERFYWINRNDQVYILNIYDVQRKEQIQYQYNQPILVTPYGEIIKLGR